jgi:hypothetical protein
VLILHWWGDYQRYLALGVVVVVEAARRGSNVAKRLDIGGSREIANSRLISPPSL